MMLDLESVRLFVLAARYRNLTRAAEAAGTVQPVVSQRIKALETHLGRRLLDRTPRFVRLTDDGALFLVRAQALLEAHNLALGGEDASAPHVEIGVSDHALGSGFHRVFEAVRASLPAKATMGVRMGQSAEIRRLYESGTLDLALVRSDGGAAEGEVLGTDPLGWYAAPGWRRSDAAVPLVMLPPPCGVRITATTALERGGLPWREAFVGGSCLALIEAVRAGLGVAALGRMVARAQSIREEVGQLPPLPASRIVLLARTPDPQVAVASRALSASVRRLLDDRAP